MPVLRLAATALCLALFTSPALAQKITVTPAANWPGIVITGEGNSEMVVFGGTTAVQGRIAICALAYTRKTFALHQQMMPEILRNIRFTVGQTQLIPQPEDIPVYASESEARKLRKAGCTLTKHPADPALMKQPVMMELRSGTIYHF